MDSTLRSHTAGDAGAATTQWRGVAVGVTASVHNQGLSPEVRDRQSGSPHWVGGGAVCRHKQSAEVTSVAGTIGAEMVAGAIRVPVPTRSQSGNRNPIADEGLTAVARMEVEAMLPRGKATQVRLDHQSHLAIAGSEAADHFAHTGFADALHGDCQFGCRCRCSADDQQQQDQD